MIYSQRICLTFGVLSTLAVLFAVWSQLVLGMLPCPWCIAQRVVLVCMAAVAFTASLNRGFSRAGLAGVGLLGLTGAAAAMWQAVVASKASSCALTLPDRWLAASGLDSLWPLLFEPRASCADAAARLLGAPYEAWSFALFALTTGWALKAWRASRTHLDDSTAR